MGIGSSILNWWKNLGLKDYRILMLGLDNAGKTTILYKLKLGDTITTIPTIIFNVEGLRIEGIKITVWDVGGQGRMRPLWRHYIPYTDGLIFVVDSADTERLIDAKEELSGILDYGFMRGVPVLVIANKQDMQDALTARQIVKELDLTNLDNRQWYVQNASAKTGEGLMDAMKQFASMVKEFKSKKS